MSDYRQMIIALILFPRCTYSMFFQSNDRMKSTLTINFTKKEVRIIASHCTTILGKPSRESILNVAMS